MASTYGERVLGLQRRLLSETDFSTSAKGFKPKMHVSGQSGQTRCNPNLERFFGFNTIKMAGSAPFFRQDPYSCDGQQSSSPGTLISPIYLHARSSAPLSRQQNPL